MTTGALRGARSPAQRLATLERQLHRYLRHPLPPTTDARQLKRRMTLRQRVVRDNLRRQRALQVHGHECGWRSVPLTTDDEQRVARLAPVPPIAYYLEIRTQHARASRRGRFSGPDTYVAVQVVPYGAMPLKTLNHHIANLRGITIKMFGVGYRAHSGPRSQLGAAIAAAEAFIGAHRML